MIFFKDCKPVFAVKESTSPRITFFDHLPNGLFANEDQKYEHIEQANFNHYNLKLKESYAM